MCAATVLGEIGVPLGGRGDCPLRLCEKAGFGSATAHRHGTASGRSRAQPTFEGSRWTARTWRAGAESQPHAEFRATLCARPRTMHPLIESHRHPLIELARKRGIGNLRVFGSMARGDADADSDVDLLVTLPPGASALALGGLLMDAQELLGRQGLGTAGAVARTGGLSNVLVHGYLGIDIAAVWSVVEHDLPGLSAARDHHAAQDRAPRAVRDHATHALYGAGVGCRGRAQIRRLPLPQSHSSVAAHLHAPVRAHASGLGARCLFSGGRTRPSLIGTLVCVSAKGEFIFGLRPIADVRIGACACVPASARDQAAVAK